YDLENWDSLWGLLVAITLSKCARRMNYFHAAKRDVDRELPGTSARSDEAPFDREPLPEEAAMLTETVEELMRGLEAHERDMVSLFLQGQSVLEISERVGWAERTVHRVLARVRRRLQRLRDQEASAP